METFELIDEAPIPGLRLTFTFALIADLQFFGSWSGDPMRLPLRWGRSPILRSLRPRNRPTTSSVTLGVVLKLSNLPFKAPSRGTTSAPKSATFQPGNHVYSWPEAAVATLVLAHPKLR
jgi:hypothetical protein